MTNKIEYQYIIYWSNITSHTKMLTTWKSFNADIRKEWDDFITNKLPDYTLTGASTGILEFYLSKYPDYETCGYRLHTSTNYDRPNPFLRE